MLFWKRRAAVRHDFDQATLPWVDRAGAPAEIERRHGSGLMTATEAEQLLAWHTDGAVMLRGAVEHSLVDQLWADYERGWQERPVCLFEAAGTGQRLWADAQDRAALIHHFRLMDFHNLSEAGSRIMLHPAIVRFCQLLLDEPPVGMQTLLFEFGTEQGSHQDFAYVHAGILSHLVAAWVACEDIGPDAGPLFFYPGSHRLPKFDFGGGRITYDYKHPEVLPAFSDYLQEQCLAHTLPRELFVAKKGDVLLWHGAVVHGGSPVVDARQSRKSFVAHYSSRRAYPRERRHPLVPPRVTQLNGASFYQWRRPGHVEWQYRLPSSSH